MTYCLWLQKDGSNLIRSIVLVWTFSNETISPSFVFLGSGKGESLQPHFIGDQDQRCLGTLGSQIESRHFIIW